jgi:hypothetical protein
MICIYIYINIHGDDVDSHKICDDPPVIKKTLQMRHNFIFYSMCHVAFNAKLERDIFLRSEEGDA